MLNPKIDDLFNFGRTRILAVRNRMANGLAGRSRQVVALATLAGVALIGFLAAAIDSAPQPNTTNASVETRRDQAADKANRSARDSQTPTNDSPPSSIASPTQAPEPAKSEAPPSPEAKKKADWVLPMDAPTSSCFGPRWGTQHQGIDFAGDENTPIVAVGAGEVIGAGWIYTGYGISVVVDHGNGYLTHYAHMNKEAVAVGDRVNPGDLLGYEGSTGDSTGPHLHFEVHNGMWNQVDPAQWMSNRGVTIDGC